MTVSAPTSRSSSRPGDRRADGRQPSAGVLTARRRRAHGPAESQPGPLGPAWLAEQAAKATSLSELARTLGVHHNIGRKALLRYDIPIPHRAKEVDVDELRRLHAEGETIAGLARHFEVTRDRVRRPLG
jgi:hypothetical protein